MIRVVLLSCLLYLVGVVLVLYLKPTLMFDKSGTWKEFGFVKDDKRTWFPFWLFCILWALISFFIVNFFFGESNSVVSVGELKTDSSNENIGSVKPVKSRKKIQSGNDARPGYYMLDKESSEREGFAKYVYLGPNMPTDNRDE
jgi:hypothetical protein